MSISASEGYAGNFWSNETDASVSVLTDHFHESTKTIEYLLQFYKERIAIENEYARKLNNLTRKTGLNSIHKETATLTDSIRSLVDETKQLSNSHTVESEKISELVYLPLKEYLGNVRARNKPWESTVLEFVKYKENFLATVRQSQAKYEALWKKISSYKTEQILMDEIEANIVQKKIDKVTGEVINQRTKCFKMINKYNKIQETFKQQWCKCCVEFQRIDEDRIKFIRKNMWEYANGISSACIGDDQSAENIRLSLEKCSYVADIKGFIKTCGTGNKSCPPLKFVDFAKGEDMSTQITSSSKAVDVDELLRSTRSNENNSSSANPPELPKTKKRYPAKATEEQETKLEMIARSNKTYSELRRGDDAEIDAKHSDEGGSEPSTYKMMSDYSATSTETTIGSSLGIASKKAIPNMNTSVFSNPLLHSTVSSSHQNSSLKGEKSDATDILTRSSDPLKAYLSDLSLGGNGDMSKLRESMKLANSQNGSKIENSSNKRGLSRDIHDLLQGDDEQNDYKSIRHEESVNYHKKSISCIPTFPAQTNIAMNRKTSKDGKQRPWSTEDIENELSNNSSRISSIRSHSVIHRRVSSLRRTKSQQSLGSKLLSMENLPTHSSEGFPVLKYYKAQYNYNAEIEQELSFKKKDILMILHQQLDGWWFAEDVNSGESGLAPSNYLVEL